MKKGFFSPGIFSLMLGGLIFVIFSLFSLFTIIPEDLENKILDLNFILKGNIFQERKSSGVLYEKRSSGISKDIIIIGIDNKALSRFGRWPFPRYRHAQLLNSFAGIKNQNDRESAVLLDLLFNEVSDRAFDDVMLIDAIKNNGRVALETLHSAAPIKGVDPGDLVNRLNTLIERFGVINSPEGDLSKVMPNYGMEAPLVPYGNAVKAYGHASIAPDKDEVFRRQKIIARYSLKVRQLDLNDLKPGLTYGAGKLSHIGWTDKQGVRHWEQLPLSTDLCSETIKEIKRNGLPSQSAGGSQLWEVSVYNDYYVPSITLSLALQYFNKTLDDVDVVFGSHVIIHSPQVWNPDIGEWVKYGSLDEIRIPIDESGNMLINYMGPRSSADPGGLQTYPVRSYASYASAKPGKTWKLGGKILMVGAFSQGMADDEKNSPLGLMFGVEIHANALNTIIMNNFISRPPQWVNYLILFILVMLTALMTSGMKKVGWSAAVVILFTGVSFIFVFYTFQNSNLLFNWATPVIAVLVTYFSVVIYRVVSAEKDKRQIKNIFGQFVSPAIVEQLTQSPPELGGVDVEATVMFSDIRGFTHLSEGLSSKRLVDLLNEYLTVMTDNLVVAYSGTLDKYIGDAIMAFWGAPRPQEDHAERACKSAVAQLRLLNQLNKRLNEEYGLTINIGIGLNSGICTVGYMGSEGRKNYTAMGDTVNLASRLEGVNKTYGTNIIISEYTYEKIKDKPFIIRELDDIKVKGRNKPVTIYQLLDYDGELIDKLQN